MNKPKIYISGPITNTPNYLQNFRECQDYIIKEGIFDPINPAAIVKNMIETNLIKPENKNEKCYLKIALQLMLNYDCNDIIKLPGFSKSEGAMIEYRLAIDLGYKIHNFIENERILYRE